MGRRRRRHRRSTTVGARAIDIAIVGNLQGRAAALTGSGQRIGNGTHGRSLRSGLPIPGVRLEVNPTAELTVEEATSRHRDE